MNSRHTMARRAAAFLATALPILITGHGKADEVRLDLQFRGIYSRLPSYRPIQLHLDLDKPVGITKLPPNLLAPRYGKLKLGPRESPNRYYIVLDRPPGLEPRLFVDANGNGDLTDDPPAEWRRSLAGRTYLGGATLAVFYGVEMLPLHVNMYYCVDGNEGALCYFRDYARVGKVTLSEKIYDAVLTDDQVCGDFRDSGVAAAPALLIVDLNGDGSFHPRDEGFPVNKPFNVGGATYEIKEMTPSGSSFKLVKSSRVVPDSKPRALPFMKQESY
ncbi:MAG: hypothetical protein WD894_12770 [Pirellulales bacterium]